MADQPRVPGPGETVAGKYRVLRVIGEGGMGVVLEAEHMRLRQRAAIKFLSPDMRENVEVVERFEREARAAANFKNPHVVRVTDVEMTPEGLPYMVMELLSGTDLESYRTQKGRLSASETAEFLLQACDALAEAHAAGIVHRDLKPGNLFLTNLEDRVFVKVLDFGISKFMQEEKKLTSAGAVMGTALYMSPEQIRAEPVDGRSDIWSLGIILYELLSGDTPWTGPATRVAAGIVSEPLPDIRAKVSIPEPLARLIEAMLEKDPARRVPSIEDVIAGLAPHAPAEGLGGEIAAKYARRSSRSLTAPLASTPSIPAASAVTQQRVLAPERSTTGPTTMQARIAARSRKITIAAVAVCGALAIAGIALIRASTQASGAPTMAASIEPVPAESAIPSAAAAVEPVVEAPKEEPAPSASASTAVPPKPAATHGGVKPAASGRASPSTPPATATATAKAPKPLPSTTSTSNPLFLQ